MMRNLSISIKITKAHSLYPVNLLLEIYSIDIAA